MLVEVNKKGQTHEERTAETSVFDSCNGKFSKQHGYCLNCGWRPAHVQERGAEIVIHKDWEGRNLEWYDKQLREKTLAGRIISGE